MIYVNHIIWVLSLGEDAIRLKSIEGQLKAAMDKHRHKKKQFVQLKTDVQVRQI
jgi:hypothetical protein